MSERIERRKRDTRQRIAQAALELFASKGIDATTVADITEAADIGKGTFFTYFPTKEDVLAEAGALLMERISQEVALAQGDTTDAGQVLERALMPGVAWHEANPKLSRLTLAVMARQPGSMDSPDQSVAALADLLAAIVESGKAEGRFRADADASTAASVLLGVYFMGLLEWHQRGAKPGALVGNVRAGLALVLEGLRA